MQNSKIGKTRMTENKSMVSWNQGWEYGLITKKKEWTFESNINILKCGHGDNDW
jgi:hypothetical protein